MLSNYLHDTSKPGAPMIEAIAPAAVGDGEAGFDAHAGRRVSVTEVAVMTTVLVGTELGAV